MHWCVQCGGDADDDDIQTSCTVQSLRCPLTGSRIVKPARFHEVGGMAVFDLQAFLETAKRSLKWQCPHSMINSKVDNLQVSEGMTHFPAPLF